MENIIVEIILGATGGETEFMLPAHVPLASLLEGVARLIEQTHPNISFPEEGCMLYDLERARPLQTEWTLAQSGLRDGSRLILI